MVVSRLLEEVDVVESDFPREDEQDTSRKVQQAASPKAGTSKFGATPDKKAGDGEDTATSSIPSPASNGIHTQAQWARVQLSEQSKKHQEKKSNFDSSAVSKQAQWAREQLNAQAKNQQVEKEKFDSNSVSQQARWAREQLSARANQERAKETTFDTGAVSKQAKWAKEQLRLQNQDELPNELSDYDVSGQKSLVHAEKASGFGEEESEENQAQSDLELVDSQVAPTLEDENCFSQTDKSLSKSPPAS
ncbi:hypothetical protein GUITHDRAFT_100710 [Guillardia theta CCMP2712]|uniref:Uncharacterized protein n=1 Tax=Guillardia theta (strain CCMP2712) TaxID=905079 RepID=L1JYT8_GUITC|nr:hypothetical protein GUITHDRAFT_100710 [Guillardia theta CCMP2712]EKX53741.1 hypothetical protein GUITHDRAFT_100710 [Guillardia theta CCMP2712]|eukprot:XP_005840721.1 hypothetical protein GUITHDRAFT_100710 [Guillardia theta CCMP2712]